MAQAGKKGSRRPDSGPKGATVGPADPEKAIDRDDLADHIKGNNKLQGHNQEDVRDQRRVQPHARRKTEGVVESFERMDPKRRGGEREA